MNIKSFNPIKMKTLALLLFFTLAATRLLAQANYTDAIRAGDQAFKNKEFKKAINLYFAAEAFDESKKETVKQKVNLVFAEIEKLRQEAEMLKNKANEAQKETEKALKNVEIQKNTADSALKVSKSIIDALYFYDGKFALASREDIDKKKVYDFINKKGETIIDYKYEYATAFDERGFAKVKFQNQDKEYYMIDTTGSAFLLAENLNELNERTEFLDLKDKEITFADSSILKIYKYLNLKILDLSGTNQYELSQEIGKLTNLVWLSLNNTNMRNIPSEIGKLQNLNYLDLSTNGYYETLPPEILGLKKLQYLNLSGALLKQLPKEIGELQNLIFLNLKNNQLVEIPKEIGKLSKLSCLDLYWNNELRNLPYEIFNLKKLSLLCLTGTNLENNYRFDKDTISKNTESWIIGANWNTIGIWFQNKNKIDSAISWYNRSVREYTSYEPLYNLGICYLIKNEHQKSFYYSFQALKLANSDEKKSDSWLFLGDLYNLINNRDSALFCYKKSKSYNPENKNSFISLINFYTKSENVDMVGRYYESGIKLSKFDSMDNVFLKAAIDGYLFYKNYKCLNIFLEQYHKKKIEDEYWIKIGESDKEEYKLDNAFYCYNRVSNQYKDFSELSEKWDKLGVFYFNVASHDSAILCFQKSIGLNPKHFWAYRNAGLNYIMKKDYINALNYLNPHCSLKWQF